MARWQSSGTEQDLWDHWDQILWICGKQWKCPPLSPPKSLIMVTPARFERATFPLGGGDQAISANALSAICANAVPDYARPGVRKRRKTLYPQHLRSAVGPFQTPRRICSSPALTHALLQTSLARGLVSVGGLRGSSAALIRSSSFAPASARSRACCCCTRVGGRPGSGGGNWIGGLSVSRATASRRGSSGYSRAAHQHSA